MANSPQEIRYRLATAPDARSRQRTKHAAQQPVSPARPLPRITRLMALAIKLDDMLHEHSELSYQDLARLGHVSGSRVTQVLNLLLLAPDIQERLLWLEPSGAGRERIHERALRRISSMYDWRLQRLAFNAIASDSRPGVSAVPIQN